MLSSTRIRSTGGRSRTVRIGAVVTEILDKNLEVYCLKVGISKQEAFKAALREFLQKNGMDPDKLPKVSISY